MGGHYRTLRLASGGAGRVSPFRIRHFAMGRYQAPCSAEPRQLVAPACGSSVLPRLSNDLAAAPSTLCTESFNYPRATFTLGVITLSIVGTVSVETPFLLHLAGTSEWQRLAVLSLGLGVIAVSALILLLWSRCFSPTQACVVGLETAYLANATLCLVVYSGASGGIRSHSGWLVSMVVIWPIALELAWLLFQSFRGEATQTDLSIA